MKSEDAVGSSESRSQTSFYKKITWFRLSEPMRLKLMAIKCTDGMGDRTFLSWSLSLVLPTTVTSTIIKAQSLSLRYQNLLILEQHLKHPVIQLHSASISTAKLHGYFHLVYPLRCRKEYSNFFINSYWDALSYHQWRWGIRWRWWYIGKRYWKV